MHNAITARQFSRLSPRTLRHNHRRFRRNDGMITTQGLTVNFHYLGARPAIGGILRDKLVVSATYRTGADLYDVEVVYVDGTTLESTRIALLEGLLFDQFANLDKLIEVAVSNVLWASPPCTAWTKDNS